MRLKFTLATLLLSLSASGQEADTTQQLLQEVEVRAFNSSLPVFNLPATVTVLGKEVLARNTKSSWLPVFNTSAGIRMEERSPGSYRLSVRGSLLRSPFGIRNIKMYWNGLPLTDAGGNTYFNVADRSAAGRIEILKGPAGSVYGSGTGGVVLLTDTYTRSTDTPGWLSELELTGGSYGLFSVRAGTHFSSSDGYQDVRVSYQRSDGYRDNSALERTTLVWKGDRHRGALSYSWLVQGADLYYQTPGGLNLAQYEANPKASRPATATLPSARDQKAAIYNKQVFSGFRLNYQQNTKLNYYAAVSATYVDFTNPFITNYEKRTEPGFTLRGGAVYTRSQQNWLLQLQGGVEYGYQSAGIRNFDNNGGERGALQYDDQIRTGYLFPFVQGVIRMDDKWTMQGGLSYNMQGYAIKRRTSADRFDKKDNDPQWMPRISVQRTLSELFSVYGIVSRGYSPPTAAEVRPSDGSVRDSLQPESGWNRELGIRFRSKKGRLRGSLQAFRFGLENTIVRRIGDNGGEYFVNAGKTVQQGLETEWQADLILGSTGQPKFGYWLSLSWYDFRFRDYKVDATDFSGNRVTGVPPLALMTGFDYHTASLWSVHLSLAHTAEISLNDLGDEQAEAYQLLGLRVQKSFLLKKFGLTLFAGADNLLNQRFSLGNDLNAVGRRYYNAAPLRNYEAGVRLTR
mgnify:CR=1 FL=1